MDRALTGKAKFSLMRGSIPGVGSEPLAVLQRAAEMGASEAAFYSLFELHTGLDDGALHEVKAEADRLGIAIAASLDWLNPLRLERQQREVALGGGDYARGVVRVLGAMASIGISETYFTIGTLEDRDASDWAAQLDAVGALLVEQRPMLRDVGMRLLVKTHEEVTSFEALGLVERVGADVLGVSFDPVNALVRVEDPVAAAKRLAPHIAQLHIDDAILKFEGDGIRRYLAPVGDGVVDWETLLAIAPNAKRLIELHRGQFAMPVFDPAWRRRQGHLSLDAFATVVGHAAACGDRSPIDQDDVGLRLPSAIALAQR